MPLDFFRSEEMVRAQLYLQPECVHRVVHELAKRELVQFNDLIPNTNTLKRPYTNDIKTCDSILRRVQYFEDTLGEERAESPRLGMGKANLDLEITDSLFQLDQKLEKDEETLHGFVERQEMLKREADIINEHSECLQRSITLMGDDKAALDASASSNAGDPLLATFSFSALSLISGVIPLSRMTSLRSLILRDLRGNAIFKHSMIEGGAAGEDASVVFLVFCQGDYAKNRATRISEASGAKLYSYISDSGLRNGKLSSLRSELTETKSLLSLTREKIHSQLANMCTYLYAVKRAVLIEKEVFLTMNMLNHDSTSQLHIGDIWVCKKDVSEVRSILNRVAIDSGSSVPSFLEEVRTKDTPPTYFKTNKVTKVFYSMIASYGIPDYREANPALFALVTFPFLFAVMYGDIGHGFIMALFGFLLCKYEKKIPKKARKDDLFGYFYEGRYIIMMMGCYSMITGLIYNDCFSLSFHLFESSYKLENGVYTRVRDAPYAFGFDFAWREAKNELLFSNSFKMKHAVVLGVLQMLLGLFINLTNILDHGDRMMIWLDWLPQVLFLSSIFGYLTLTFYIKWLSSTLAAHPSSNPSLIHILINMFLKFSASAPGERLLFPGQRHIQIFLFIIIVICIPWLFLAKPLYLKRKLFGGRKRKVSNDELSLLNTSDMEYNAVSDDEEYHGSAHDHYDSVGDLWINSCIHAIEFILSCISNTASYLRLWALSLAHAQLSEVFWNLLMVRGLHGNFFALFVFFIAWAFMTVAVLLLMESLSAFLHALRLHWVEFCSKMHFGAAGIEFKPLNLQNTEIDLE
ncbi:hypothetical protein PCE1_002578 [Barthelona sp. PCE]